jgi:nucleotide-binding universal stress UspA family protein
MPPFVGTKVHGLSSVPSRHGVGLMSRLGRDLRPYPVQVIPPMLKPQGHRDGGLMAQRMVVGFDGSPAATAALTWAVTEARLRGAQLDAWMVEERPAHESGSGRPATSVPQAAVEKCAGGYPVTLRHGHGDAASELIRACADADLLVVGSHGRGRLSGLILGSVSRICLAHAPCPVVVVRSHPKQASSAGRVIVGIDASDHSRAALRVAAEEARLRGTELDVVHAVHWNRSGYEMLTPTEEQLVEWGRRLVATELASAGVAGRPVVVHGHAPEVLERESADADLLVLGQRGRGAVRGPRLGSVSEHCARLAVCPVMVITAVGARERDSHAQVRTSDSAT